MTDTGRRVRLLGVALSAAVLCACATPRHDAKPSRIRLDRETIAVCREQFPAGDGWKRIAATHGRVPALAKQYPLEIGTSLFGEFIPAAIWYRNSSSGGYASCSKSSCGVDDCYWRVRTFSEADGQWYRAINHDVAVYYSN